MTSADFSNQSQAKNQPHINSSAFNAQESFFLSSPAANFQFFSSNFLILTKLESDTVTVLANIPFHITFS
jgi:hypothetical protein